eukprot:gene12117-5609_t
MHKFPIKRINNPKSYQIVKFPKEVDFSKFKDAKVRQKTIEDEMIVDDEVTDATKRITKQDGHIATSDRQYFGEKRPSDYVERKTWVLDDPSLTSIRYEGNALKESQSTCYYIFIKKGKDFIALPVEENWTYFKPVVKQKIQSTEEAEAQMKEEKKNMKGFFEKLSKVPGFEDAVGNDDEEVVKKKTKKKIKKEEESYMEGGFSDDEEFDFGQGGNISEPDEDLDEKEEDEKKEFEGKKQIKQEDHSSDDERKTKKRKMDQMEMPVDKKKKIETTSSAVDQVELKNAIVEILTTQSKVTIKKLTKFLSKSKNFDKEKIKAALSNQTIKQIAKLVLDEESGQKILVLK